MIWLLVAFSFVALIIILMEETKRGSIVASMLFIPPLAASWVLWTLGYE